MSNPTKRSHEAIADEAAQRYIADSLAAPHIMLIQRRSFIAGYEAAEALREPIAVTDAMVDAGFAAQCNELPEFGNETTENMRRVARVTIEAALSHSSAEKRDNPITATDAMVEAGSNGATEWLHGFEHLEIILREIEAVLKMRSEE